MNPKEFEELENNIEGNSFIRAHSANNKLWGYAGYLFQTINIAICLWGLVLFLSSLISDFPGKDNILLLISLIVLVLWEALKRSTIAGISLKLFSKRPKGKAFTTSLLLGILLAGGSAYLAVRGAKEISDKAYHTEKTVVDNSTSVLDSVRNEYDQRIKALEMRQEEYLRIAQERGRAMNRNEASQAAQWVSQSNTLALERDARLGELKARTEAILTREVNKNGSNVLVFLIITLAIELMIIIGVGYQGFYLSNVYSELAHSPRYTQYRLYVSLLDMAYQKGKIKEGGDSPSNGRLEELYRIKTGKTVDPKPFYSLLTAIAVIETKGNKRRFLKSYDRAKEMLEGYFELT